MKFEENEYYTFSEVYTFKITTIKDNNMYAACIRLSDGHTTFEKRLMNSNSIVNTSSRKATIDEIEKFDKRLVGLDISSIKEETKNELIVLNINKILI